MKLLITALTILSSSLLVMAQDCDTKQTSSGVVITTSLEQVGTNNEKAGALNYGYLMFRRTGDAYVMQVTMEARVKRILGKGTPVILVFNDSSQMKLVTAGEVKWEVKRGKAFTQGSKTPIYYNSPTFNLTKEQMKSFAFKQLVSITSAGLTYIIDKPEVISKIMACVYQNQP